MNLADALGMVLVVTQSWPPVVPAEVQYIWIPLAMSIYRGVRRLGDI